MVEVWLPLQLYLKQFWCSVVIYWHRNKIKPEVVYEEFFKHKHLFDFRNFPKDSKFSDEANKKVIGKMKDEFGGIIVDEFVGLKSKMYSKKKLMEKN